MSLLKYRIDDRVSYFFMISTLIAIAILALGSAGIKLGWLYFKNGSSIDVAKYRVDFPMLHWANYKELKNSYIVFNMQENSNINLAIFKKRGYRVNLRDYILYEGCINLRSIAYKNSSISGKMYICKKPKGEDDSLIFLTDGNRLLFRGVGFKKIDSSVINEYALLIKGISKR